MGAGRAVRVRGGHQDALGRDGRLARRVLRMVATFARFSMQMSTESRAARAPDEFSKTNARAQRGSCTPRAA